MLFIQRKCEFQVFISVVVVDNPLTLNYSDVCLNVSGELQGFLSFQDTNGADNMIANLILQRFFSFLFFFYRGLNSDKVGLTCVFIVLLPRVYFHVMLQLPCVTT